MPSVSVSHCTIVTGAAFTTGRLNTVNVAALEYKPHELPFLFKNTLY